jgi:hypothetical protein
MRKIALLAVVAFAAACGGSSSTPGTGYLRVANLSPDLGDIDFCIAPAGTTTFTGPVLANTTGGTAGLKFPGDGSMAVSKYFSYEEGSYDVRIISKGAGATCATPLLTASSVSLGNGVYKLVAAVGNTGFAGAAHATAVFTDETTAASNRVNIRFVNAGLLALPGPTYSAMPALNIGFTVGGTYSGIFTNVGYPGIGAAVAPVDANGYASIDPTGITAGAQITSCLYPATSGATCQSAPLPTGTVITGGMVASAYVIGIAGSLPNALLCGDNQTPIPNYPYSLCIAQ